MGMSPICRLRLSFGFIQIALNMLWGRDKGRKGQLSPQGIEILYSSYFSSVKMSDVASMLNVSRSTATDLINYLEREGFVKRVRGDDDHRTFFITPTEKGNEWVLSTEERLFGYLSDGLSHLNGKEQEDLAQLLEKFSGVDDEISFMTRLKCFKESHPAPVPLIERRNGELLRLEEVVDKRYGKVMAASPAQERDFMISARIPETDEGIQDEITVEQYDIMQKGLLDAGHLSADSLCRSGINSGTGLEIGPGPGYYGLEWLRATSGTKLVGVEISPAMIRLAQKNAAAYGMSKRTEYRQGNALSMPVDDGSVDAAFSNGSLHEWEDAGAVFNEIARVLKPGGKYCVTDLRRDLAPDIYRFMYDACEPAEIRPGFASSVGAAYTKKEIERILEGSRLTGWTVIAHPYGLVIAGRVS